MVEMRCGGSLDRLIMRAALPKNIKRELLEELTRTTRLKPAEVKALYARFRRLAPRGFLLPEQFTQTMGVLGLTDDHFLPDRMFKVFDIDQDGRLSFDEFARSLAVMIRGTEDEKLKLSFEMTAGYRGASGILVEDFEKLVTACNTMMSSLVAPSRSRIDSVDTRRLFHDLASSAGESQDEGKEVITLEAYKEAAHSNDDFLVCLGLEPTTRRRHGSKSSVGPRERACSIASENLSSPSPTAANSAQGYAVVPLGQLEELREQVLVLRRTVQHEQQHRLGRRQRAIFPSCASQPESSQRGPEFWRWWMPFDCCRQPRRPPPDMGQREPSEEASRDGPQQSDEEEVNFDGVVQELDGIIGWCTELQRDGAAEPVRPSYSRGSDVTRSSGSRPMTDATNYDSLSTANSDARVEDRPQRKFSKSNIHGASGVELGSASPTRRQDRERAKERRARTQRQHRLLGPKKGLAIHFGHENWNMVLSMMVGIRMAVGRTRHEFMRELQPVDFIMKEKLSIIPNLANIFDSAVSKRVTMTRFIDYAPMVFQRIRSKFGIQHDDYLRSVGPEQLLGNMVLGNLSSLSELSSEGKSGAFFYYTADGNYMMKTISPKEHQLFKRMLKRYFDYITQNPGTLIVRFLGLHCLRLQKQRKGTHSVQRSAQKLYFVVMGNMFNTPFEIHRRYDLKGSWVGRLTPSVHRDPTAALKDVDFQQASEAIHVGEERRARLVSQIESDSRFLCDNNIIDYSLLLGICEQSPASSSTAGGAGGLATGDRERAGSVHSQTLADFSRDGRIYSLDAADCHAGGFAGAEVPLHQRDLGGLLSSDRKSLYFLGIIDILTSYDSYKKLEHHLKALRHDRHGVSCCPPDAYATRFNTFMRNAIT